MFDANLIQINNCMLEHNVGIYNMLNVKVLCLPSQMSKSISIYTNEWIKYWTQITWNMDNLVKPYIAFVRYKRYTFSYDK